MSAYGVKIGAIGSHGKARITAYGQGYPIVTGIIKEFSPSTWHWDSNTQMVDDGFGGLIERTIGLVAEPYPLSPEEIETERILQEHATFMKFLKSISWAQTIRIGELERDASLMRTASTDFEARIAALEEWQETQD